MSASPPPDRNTRAALLVLQRLLAEADRALATGDLGDAEAALGRVGTAFERLRRRQQEAMQERAIQTALEAARRIAALTLTRLLADVDTLLGAGDMDGVKTALQRAKATVDAARELEESAQHSGIRSRFPSKLAK